MNTFFKHKGYAVKHLCRFVLVLFALMPCAVKNALFAETAFQQAVTLNVSKVPGDAAASCAVYTQETVKNRVAGVMQRVGADTEKSVPYAPKDFFFCGSARNLYYAANAPPLYILYKRLKIDAVV